MTWLKCLRTLAVCILGGASLAAWTAEPDVPSRKGGSPALLLCLDRSGSMGIPAIAAMQAAVREAVLARDAKGRLPFQVGLMAFGTQTLPMLDLTDDAARVEAAIARLQPDRTPAGKTRLYDAVAGGLAQLRAADATSRHLILVSDGDDDGSDLSQAQLVRRITEAGVSIDAIAFGKQAAAHAGSLSTLAGAGNGSFQIAAQAADLRAAMLRLVSQAVDTTAPAPGTPAASAPAPGATSAPARPAVGISFPLSITALSARVQQMPPLAWGGLGLVLLAALLLGTWLMVRRRAVRPAPGDKQGGMVTSPTVVPVARAGRASRASRASPEPEPQPGPAAPPRPTTVGATWPVPDGRQVVALLKIAAGAHAVRRVEMRTPVLRLGWDRDNDVVLEKDEYVSAHHAALRAEAQKLYVDDLGALNGTELNGVRFKRCSRALNPGDRITLGRTAIEVLGMDHAG